MGGLIVFVAFLTSPSHTVGLELEAWAGYWLAGRWFMLPSHTVGLELTGRRLKNACWHVQSPSHAVGSEHEIGLGNGKVIYLSPSHTVGSEQT